MDCWVTTDLISATNGCEVHYMYKDRTIRHHHLYKRHSFSIFRTNLIYYHQYNPLGILNFNHLPMQVKITKEYRPTVYKEKYTPTRTFKDNLKNLKKYGFSLIFNRLHSRCAPCLE